MCVLNESAHATLTGEQLLDLVFIEAPGTIARLDRGANLLFANCGRGAALVELARMFPRSRFFGCESSPADLAAAREAARANWLQNIRLEPDTGSLPYLTGIFHFALRQPPTHGTSLAEIARLLREVGLLFDLSTELPTRQMYDEAALTRLSCVQLPDGFCAIACK